MAIAVSPLAALLAAALAARLYSQPGIPLYPDSYEFILGARRLNPLSDVAATMGPGGDLWSIPFHRVGFALIAAPFSLSGDTVSALAFAAGVLQAPVTYLLLARLTSSKLSAFLVALLVATSFSAVGWSRVPMSDSAALLVALSGALLLMLAIERRHTLRVAAAALALGLLMTMRAELILFLPGLLALPWSLRRPAALPTVARLLAASVLLWLTTIATLTIVAGDNLRGLSGGPWSVLQANLFAGRADGLLGAGFRAFVSHEAPLLAVAALGAILSLAQRDRRGVAAALLVGLPFALYATRDDLRYYLYLMPGLSMLAALALERLGPLSVRALPLGAPLLGGLAALALVGGAAWQGQRLGEAWHPALAYEQEAALSVSRLLEELRIPDNAMICAPRAEAYFLAAGRPARHLPPTRPQACFEGLAAGQPVVIVKDALVQSTWLDALPSAVAAKKPVLLATLPSPGPLVVGERHYLATTPIRVYLLQAP